MANDNRIAAVLPRRVGRFLDSLKVPAAGMVVAVSGGPDSVALLRVLLALRGRAAGPLLIAHLNHQLRGAESDADENFVRTLYTELSTQGHEGLCLLSERLDVAAAARAERKNLESVARRLRYAWLAEAARKAGLPHVATGHTADDQAETVLHRLLRGTGLKGLRGIAARRPLAEGVELVRPLLTTTRPDVLAYLANLGQGFRQDSSNWNPRLTRNRIRHQLLPQLAREYNPAITTILCRLAEEAAQAYHAESSQAAALLAQAELPRAGPVLVFDRDRLRRAPRHVARAMFRLVWDREGWSTDAMNFDAWQRLADVVHGDLQAIDLPDRRTLRVRDRVVQLTTC